MNICPTG